MSVETNPSLPREQFIWSTNPLITDLRPLITEQLRDGTAVVFNELDVIIQSLLSVCAFQPKEIWGDNTPYVNDGTDFVRSRQQGKMDPLPITPYDRRQINDELLHTIIDTHIRRSTAFKDSLPQNVADAVFKEKPLFDLSARLTTEHRFYTSRDGLDEMNVREATSGSSVVMREVSPQTSKIYAEKLHYIHRARKDEIVSFGAFLGGALFPFAWVSYAPIGSEEEQAIAELAGLNPESTIEMTRAWNTTWSPKNTMSLLFSFAHSQLQKKSKGDMLSNVKKPLSGITTAINPNLGFTGMAFRGVGFGPIGMKMTNHKFLSPNNTVPIYMLTSDIAERLGVDKSEVSKHEAYRESKVPLIPTNVLGVIFNGKNRITPDTPLYLV